MSYSPEGQAGISSVYRYKDDLFTTTGRHKDNLFILRTHFKEKAEKYGRFNIYDESGYLGRYGLKVPTNDVEYIKNYYERYRVKYREHFFEVVDENEESVTLKTSDWDIFDLYHLEINSYDMVAKKEVKRAEIIKLYDIKERIGIHRNHVYYLIDESDEEYLIQTASINKMIPYIPGFKPVKREDGSYRAVNTKQGLTEWKSISESDYNNWEKRLCRKNGEFYARWIPKEKVFVYNETDEPLRY